MSFAFPNPRLLIFAKAPVPGRVKTQLAVLIGGDCGGRVRQPLYPDSDPRPMNPRNLLLLLILVVLIAACFFLDLGRFFSLDSFKSQQAAIEACRAAHPGLTAGAMARPPCPPEPRA